MATRMRDTAQWRRLSEAFSSGRQMTYEEAADAAHLSVRSARRYIRIMRGEPLREVRVARWISHDSGEPTPVFARGAAPDAAKPPTPPASKRMRKYRQRRAARSNAGQALHAFFFAAVVAK